VTGQARVSRATRTVLFISGDIRSGERILMTVTGVYAIKEPKGA
jgi:acyl-coenzyme A thioesterase PaaI-like protein